MSTIENTLLAALAIVGENIPGFDIKTVKPDTDVFGSVDSFVIVDLLLESETALENAFGKYVGLGDETVFDAEKSPLRKWSSWVAFVEARHAG